MEEVDKDQEAIPAFQASCFFTSSALLCDGGGGQGCWSLQIQLTFLVRFRPALCLPPTRRHHVSRQVLPGARCRFPCCGELKKQSVGRNSSSSHSKDRVSKLDLARDRQTGTRPTKRRALPQHGMAHGPVSGQCRGHLRAKSFPPK